jgi:hypothetical protein
MDFGMKRSKQFAAENDLMKCILCAEDKPEESFTKSQLADP